jgi:hypothetical protein
MVPVSENLNTEIEKGQVLKKLLFVVTLAAIGGLAFTAGVLTSRSAKADEPKKVYPEKTELDFEGLQLQGELRNPGEFYFQYRKEEKFDSLVKRRKNFHREMLRDVVSSK